MHPASRFWSACITVQTPRGAQRWKRSLRTEDRKLAVRAADALESAGCGSIREEQILAFCREISEPRAQRAISAIFGDVFRAVTGRVIGGGTLRAFAQAWLAGIAAEVKDSTHERYEKVLTDFVAFIGAAADRDIASFGARDDELIVAFRNAQAARYARSTVNLRLKTVRQMFEAAAARYHISNPAERVRNVRNIEGGTGRTERRAFTLAELGRLLRHTDGSEWQGMILAGLYTGQRLGDIALLRWENVDLQREEIALTTRKTERRMLIPIAQPLLDYLAEAATTDDPRAFVFPKAAGFVLRTRGEKTVTLSNQFHDILARCGLVRRRAHTKAKDGAGRSGRRAPSELSFHSLRHTATSLLKNAGIPQSVVMDLIGHESKAVSQVYTHVGESELRRAVSSMPSLSSLMKGKQPRPHFHGKGRHKRQGP
jgi:integrase